MHMNKQTMNKQTNAQIMLTRFRRSQLKEHARSFARRMFVLVKMKDTVRIKPHLFGLNSIETISSQLNKKFANKLKV